MKKIETEALDPAFESDGEKLHRGARIALGLVPGVGSALVEIFSSAIESPLTRRRWETMIQFGEVINDLIERRLVTEADLQNNDVFISTVAEACAISLRNHQADKMEALRNAVRNSALPACPDEDYRQIYLRFIDQFTASHIRMLRFADDPTAWFIKAGTRFPGYPSGNIMGVIDVALPELIGHSELRDMIWGELIGHRLISSHVTLESKGPGETFERKTTPLGAGLVRFVG